MKRQLVALIGGALLMSIGLLSLPLSGTHAISEVTPTPEPADPTPVPAQPTAVPTAIPETDLPADAEAVDEALDEGIAALQAGDFETAAARFSQVIAADATRSNAWLGRALAYSQLDRLDEAISDVSEAVALAPWDASIYSVRASLYAEQNNFGDALLDYNEVIRINPFQLESIAARSEVYARLGDTQAADIDAAIARGLQNLGGGNPNGALSALNEAIGSGAETPAVALAHYIAAQVYSQQNDLAGVLDSYTTALAINPDMHIVHLARGIFYRQSGELQLAGEDFAARMDIHGRETLEETIEIGETLEVEMAYQRVYRISFEGRAGAALTFSARDTTLPVDPLIALLGPDGAPVAGDDDFGGGLNSQIDDFVLPADGTYTLLVSHAEGGNSIGFQGVIRVEITSSVDV